MAIKLPDQPWNEGDSFVVDETGLEYTYNGEVWVSEGKEIDLSGLAEEDHNHSEYLLLDGGTLTGVVTVDRETGEMFVLRKSGDKTLKMWADGTIDQPDINANTSDNNMVNRKNLKDAVAGYLKKGGTQTLDEGRFLLKHPKADGTGSYSYIDIDGDEMGLYHVKTPTNDVHAANKKYVDDNSSLGRPFVYGDPNQTGQFTTASGGTSIYFNMTDLNGKTRRHRTGPDFDWPTELRYTIWDEDGILVHAGLTGFRTDYVDNKLQFKQCRPLYDQGLVDGTTYYINLEGYW